MHLSHSISRAIPIHLQLIVDVFFLIRRANGQMIWLIWRCDGTNWCGNNAVHLCHGRAHRWVFIYGFVYANTHRRAALREWPCVFMMHRRDWLNIRVSYVCVYVCLEDLWDCDCKRVGSRKVFWSNSQIGRAIDNTFLRFLSRYNGELNHTDFDPFPRGPTFIVIRFAALSANRGDIVQSMPAMMIVYGS